MIAAVAIGAVVLGDKEDSRARSWRENNVLPCGLSLLFTLVQRSPCTLTRA